MYYNIYRYLNNNKLKTIPTSIGDLNKIEEL